MAREEKSEIPKSRITLTYRIPQGIEQKELELPFRIVVMGNLSGSTPDGKNKSKDQSIDIDKRAIRRLDGKNLNKVMADMDLKVTVKVKDCIEPGTDPANPNEMEVTLPIKGMKSFTPVEIAQNVPKIKALLLLKKLLLEGQAHIDNSKEFRKDLQVISKDKEPALKALKGELTGFDRFQLPPGLPKAGG
jgi:type VI secretion system protein ImpB